MKIQTIYEIDEKAKTKKDGIYSYKGFKYIVVNSRFKAYCDFKTVYEIFAGLTVKIGEIDEIYNVTKELNKLLKKYKSE